MVTQRGGEISKRNPNRCRESKVMRKKRELSKILFDQRKVEFCGFNYFELMPSTLSPTEVLGT